MAKYKSIFAKYNKYTFNVQKCTLKVQKYTFKVQKQTFKVRKYIVKVQNHTFKVYFQRTRVHFQITRRYFQRRKVYLQSTTSILSTYKKHTFKVQKYTFKVQEYTFEVHSNCWKPWPGTFLIPRVPGTRFPETVPSKPREQNLTPRNPSNTETFKTSFTQPSEPELGTAKPVGTHRNPDPVPRTGSRNQFPEPVPDPVPSRNRPSAPRTHRNLYCATTP